MYAADPRDEVVFPRPDRFFCGVGAVVMRRYQLKADIFLAHECSELGRVFVVQEGNLWGEAAID